MATEIYRVQTTVDMQGQMASIVHHFRIVDPSVTDDFQNAIDLIAALNSGVPPIGYVNRLQLLLSDDCFISSMTATKINPVGGNSSNRVYQTDAQPGGIASPWHTGQLAGCVIWVSSTRPDVTGRNFIPGVPESQIDGGRFVAAYKTAMNNFITTMIAGFSAPGGIFFPVIYDRAAAIGYVIDDGYLSLKPGTQRRREKPL